MKKNKSIDGLTTRRTKNSLPSHSVSQKSTPKNTASKSPAPKTPKPSHPKAAPKSIKVSTPTPAPAAPHTPSNITEDFLSPVHAFDFDEKTNELKAAKPPHHSQTKMKKSKKPASKKRKIIVSVILTIVLLLVAGAVGAIFWLNGRLADMGIQGSIFDFIGETYEPLKADANGRTNILAFGTSGYDMEGSEGTGVHDGAQLTDSIMIISLDQNTGDVAMLSLPRDLKVSRTCTATGKINEIYWCNNADGTNEQAGAEALMAEVSDILGIDFQYYAHLNWGSLVSIVDILGGITVTLDEDIEDYYYTKAVFQAGTPYTINGEQALGLARARHGTTSGDFSRGASQQKILIGIKDKILSNQLGISDLLGLFDTLSGNLRVNFTPSEIKTLAHLATDLDFNNIRQISLIEPEKLMTTGNINGISYVLPAGGANYYTKIQNYVARMFSSDPRQYENATILVLNGTDTPGLAGTEQTALEESGYSNIDVDDAPIGEYTKEYTLYSLAEDKPSTKQLLEEKYNTAHPASDLPQGISTEYDFVIIIGNETSEASQE